MSRLGQLESVIRSGYGVVSSRRRPFVPHLTDRRRWVRRRSSAAWPELTEQAGSSQAIFDSVDYDALRGYRNMRRGISVASLLAAAFVLAIASPTAASSVSSFTAVPAASTLDVTGPLAWTDQTLAGFAYQVQYEDAVSATSDLIVSPTYAVVDGALPMGLSLDGSTGAITGTPSAAGPWAFTLSATRGNQSITADFSGRVIVSGSLASTGGGLWIVGGVMLALSGLGVLFLRLRAPVRLV